MTNLFYLNIIFATEIFSKPTHKLTIKVRAYIKSFSSCCRFLSSSFTFSCSDKLAAKSASRASLSNSAQITHPTQNAQEQLILTKIYCTPCQGSTNKPKS